MTRIIEVEKQCIYQLSMLEEAFFLSNFSNYLIYNMQKVVY